MNTELAAAIASFEQGIARLQEEIAEINEWLFANPAPAYGEDFTVAVRVIGKDGNKSTPSALRKVGEGFNFNGTTPATVYAMTYNNAFANAQRFNSNARRENKTDVEYSVIGLRSLFLKQRESKAESATFMQECIAKHAAA